MTTVSVSNSSAGLSAFDFGTCGKAGLQRPVLPPIASSADPGLLDMFGRRLDRRQRAIDASMATRRKGWVDWPSLALPPDLPDGRSFAWAPYTEDFHAGTRVAVYIAVCDGLISTSKAASLSCAKIGFSTRPDDLASRFLELNQDRYGSLRMLEGRMLEDAGYDSWEPLRLPASGHTHDSPVERRPRSLIVSLPASMAVDLFDDALNAMLAPMLVSTWIEMTDGKRFAEHHGFDPEALHRFTAHTFPDGSVRLKKAQEIAVFRRKQDTDKLVMAIEGVIARQLEQTPVRRGRHHQR
ncbi:MAG: hypothetical protein K2X57_28825 [Xanthobacteraceae bacterium]|nr:hypothetical protein [Xanthobacteraceae bacterium]